MKPIDMRYEGAARWSQYKSKTTINRIWSFFSSVKVGIAIIIIILILSIFGTIYPQEHFIAVTDPKAYYTEQYGLTGEIFYTIGFTRMYTSWWYKATLGMLLISLVVASLDRVVPLYRALKKQSIRKQISFLQRHRIHSDWIVDRDEALFQFQKIKLAMLKKGYSVREDVQALLAEKGRFSRWGPYINHFGLITIIIGALLMTSIPGWYLDKFVWVREGEIKPVTGTPYYVKNEKFMIELYDNSSVRRYQTDAVLYEKIGVLKNGQPELKQVSIHAIAVNDPLRYKGVRLYQADYKLDEWKEMSFTVSNKKTGEKLGSFAVDLYQPERSYELSNGMKVEIEEYFPSLSFNDNREPINVSSKPDNPAFIFLIQGPYAPEGEHSWAIIGTPLDEIHKDNVYEVNFSDLKTVHTSGLKISMNKGMSFIWTGAAIFLLGIVVGMYWQHRRIWLNYEEGIVYMGAYTNKSWVGLQKDVNFIMKESQIGGK